MTLFEIHPDRLEPVPNAELRAEGLRERADLQRLLRDQLEIVAPKTLLLAEEFGDWEDSRRRIDLLALDEEANLVVIELKTEEDGGHLELQALRYAAMTSTMTFDQACDAHEAYLRKCGLEGNAGARILEFLRWTTPNEREFAADVRIVLVAPDFSREITTTVLWLNEHDLDIRCLRLRAYKLDGRLLVDAQQVLPLPEAQDYQVRVRKKESEGRAARRGAVTEASLFAQFEAARPPEEVAIARELFSGLRDAGVEPYLTAKGFSLTYRARATTYYFCKVRLDGALAIWFDDLSRRPPFDEVQPREELRRRLSEVPGIEIGADRIAGKPRVSLAVLGDPGAMGAFQGVWRWVVERIRAG